MKSDEIQLLFATKLETYAPVEGKTLEPDLSALQETPTALLLTIAYNGEKSIHNLVGLIMDEDAYRARHGTNFPTPSRPAIYNFDIPIDTSNAVRVCREAAHTANQEDYRLFYAAERESSKFTLAVAKDTWVRKLRDPDIFYTALKPRDLQKQLQAMCVGLHATDVLNIQNKMQTYHEDMGGIPEYIKELEDTHKQSTRAGNPITDTTLLLFAANAMLHTDRFYWSNNIW